MAFSEGYRNILCSGQHRKPRKQQHVCFCLAHLLHTVCVHLGRQGEFKCKAAEQSTERKMKESEAITDNGIIDGRNLKRKCIWDLMTSCLIFGIVIFNCQHLSTAGIGYKHAASAYQERGLPEAQHWGLRAAPAHPGLAALLLTLGNCSVQNTLALLTGCVLSELLPHAGKQRKWFLTRGWEKPDGSLSSWFGALCQPPVPSAHSELSVSSSAYTAGQCSCSLAVGAEQGTGAVRMAALTVLH